MAKVNKVEVEIVATDEASPKIDRLEKKIDGLESDEARIIVTADISRLEKQLAGSKRLMEELEGDELTVQMRATGRIEDDLRAARELFDQLDGKTGTVTLTADTAGFDAAATSARTGIDEIGRSAGSSKSVLANMIGNTTQDLGALGGIAGSTGVAFGQMGEYMADASFEGEGLRSVLRSFGAVAIPIAGVAGAMLVLSQGAKQAASRTRELEEATQALTSATDEQVLATWNDMLLRMALDSKDLDDQLKKLAQTNLIGARRLLDLTVATGGQSGATQLLAEAIADAERGQAQAEETQRRYGDATDDSTGAVDSQTQALIDQTLAIANQGRALDGLSSKWSTLAVAQEIAANVINAARIITGGAGLARGQSIATGPSSIPTAAPSNVTIINPPGTPAATAGQLTIYQSRNGVRAEP